MKQITTTISPRGRVTIPTEALQALGLQPTDKVSFTINDGQVHLAPASFTLESAYGSVQPSNHPEDFEAISRIAKGAKAEATLRELKDR